MTNKYIAIFALLRLSPVHCLVVVQHSQPVVVHQGEVVSLFCQSDQEFQTCSWLLPNQKTCGPLSTTQKMCRSAGQQGSNIHFTGTNTNCSIKINGVQSAQSGMWTCRIEKDGDEVEAQNIQLTAAHQANVEFDGEIFGEYLISNKDSREQTITCRANHSRPLGSFTWYLGQENSGKPVKVENSNEILRKDYANDMIEVWQKFTLIPKPDLHGKTLNCSYVQKDHTGKALFQSSDEIEIMVHYLAPLHDGPTVVPGDASGQNINISFKFEAQPEPSATWFIKGDKELLISVGPKEQRAQNYVVYPLEKVSNFVWQARMTIANVTAEENYKEHYIIVTNRDINNQDIIEIRGDFDVSVGGLTVTVIIVIVVVLLIAIILVAMAVVYCQKKNLLCFKAAEDATQQDNPDLADLKQPLKHHPYARPST